MTPSESNRERLQKLMAQAGIASRRDCEDLILAGRVTVNGEIVRELGAKADPAVDEIRVDTVPLRMPGKHATFLVVKPKGFLSTTQDKRGRPTVLGLLPPTDRRLYPAGRLDEDSEGLLLLTDDGELTDLVTHPRYGVAKTYELRIRGRLEGAEVKRVESGVWLSEGKTGPTRIRIRKRGRSMTRVEVTLTEGRNRELRRIFAKIGHPVLSLKRIKIGNIAIGGMKPRQWRKLSHQEVVALKALAARQS